MRVKNKHEWEGGRTPSPLYIGQVLINPGRSAVVDPKDLELMAATKPGKWYLDHALEMVVPKEGDEAAAKKVADEAAAAKAAEEAAAAKKAADAKTKAEAKAKEDAAKKVAKK